MHLAAVWPSRQHLRDLYGLGTDIWTWKLSDAIFTLGGRGVENVRSTVSDGVSGLPRIGSLLTWVTFWSDRACCRSSIVSLVGTPKITPNLLVVELRGSEQITGLFISSLRMSRLDCWSSL